MEVELTLQCKMVTRIANGRICLIDGNALLYQAFYGNKADLYNPNGVKVNGVYTFLRSIISLLERPCENNATVGLSDCAKRPRYSGAAVCWDHPSRLIRSNDFSGYKANRSAMPDELRPQFPLSMQAMATLGVAQFQIPSVEADDLIATVAKLSSSQDAVAGVDIISPDKDMLQMVNDSHNVTVEHSHTGKVYDESSVVDRFGVTPGLLPELFALLGDKVDNLPGVTGVGPKRGALLMQEYGNIDNIIEACANATSGAKLPSPVKLVHSYLNQIPPPPLNLHQAAELNRMKNDVEIPEFLGCEDVFDVLSFPPLPQTNADFQSSRLYRFVQEQNFKSMM